MREVQANRRFLTQESTHPATIVSIIEFDRYIKDRKQTNAETNAVPKDKGNRVVDAQKNNSGAIYQVYGV